MPSSRAKTTGFGNRGAGCVLAEKAARPAAPCSSHCYPTISPLASGSELGKPTCSIVATVEFENIPLETLRAVEQAVGLYPSAESIGVSQHRSREKTFFREHGIPCAVLPYRVGKRCAGTHD